jgi:gluconate 2-dehydrogenase alpha chain
MAVQDRVDVVTVGAGLTAGILAWKLTQAGLTVRSLEQGRERWTSTDFQHNHDYLKFSLRHALMTNISQESWTWRPHMRAPALPFRRHQSFHPGSGLGGASIHWNVQTWRWYPTDYRYRSHHIERYGEGKLPEGSTVQDWGITYEELEPHFAAMERDFGVAGQAGNLNGEIIPGGNPFEGERTTEYPMPPHPTNIPGQMFADASSAMGYHPFPQPAAINSVGYTGLSGRPRAACLYCGFCVRYGCEVDAKASAITDYIPVALESGLYDIRYGAKVIGITVGDDGLATGVRYIDLDTGEEHEQPADIVILSAYTLTNVRLLLLSQSSAHPDGVGNDRGRVGKNYTYQISQTPVTGTFEGRRFHGYMGQSGVRTNMHDFNADNFDHSDLDFIGGADIAAGPNQLNPLDSTLGLNPINADRWEDLEETAASGEMRHPLLYTEVSDLQGEGLEWGQDWKENLRNNWDNQIGVSIQGESLPYEDHFLDLDPTYTDSFGLPLLRITFDFKENDQRLYRFVTQRIAEIMESMNPTRMSVSDELGSYRIDHYQSTHCNGGAIMGDNPDTSVTNKYGQVWDTPNVFVTGAALYPQNAGMNPTGPLMGLAYHTGDAMVDQYVSNPEELMD